MIGLYLKLTTIEINILILKILPKPFIHYPIIEGETDEHGS